ncbi:hypothetical protein AAC387_Pa12g1081 [Persea americana]
MNSVNFSKETGLGFVVDKQTQWRRPLWTQKQPRRRQTRETAGSNRLVVERKRALKEIIFSFLFFQTRIGSPGSK